MCIVIVYITLTLDLIYIVRSTLVCNNNLINKYYAMPLCLKYRILKSQIFVGPNITLSIASQTILIPNKLHAF